jgi:hypothetical protein
MREGAKSGAARLDLMKRGRGILQGGVYLQQIKKKAKDEGKTCKLVYLQRNKKKGESRG